MRISEPPWRFDIKIPHESRALELAIADAGDGPRPDIAAWCDAGFVIPDYKGWEQSP